MRNSADPATAGGGSTARSPGKVSERGPSVRLVALDGAADRARGRPGGRWSAILAGVTALLAPLAAGAGAWAAARAEAGPAWLAASLCAAVTAGAALAGLHRPWGVLAAVAAAVAGAAAAQAPLRMAVLAPAAVGGLALLAGSLAARRALRRARARGEALEHRVSELAATLDRTTATADAAATAVRIAGELIGEQNAEQLPDRIARLAVRELHGAAALLLRQEGGESLRICGHAGSRRGGELRGIDLPVSAVPRHAGEAEPACWEVGRLRSALLTSVFREAGCRSVLVIPCPGPAGGSGALLLVGRRHPPPAALGGRDREVARQLALHAGAALSICHLVSELRAANRLKEEFLATMSHELRTPLNIIVGYTDLQLDGAFGDLVPEQREVLEKVRSQADGLLNLIGEALDAGRIERGLFAVRPREVSPAAVLEELQRDVAPGWRKPAVALRWSLEPGLPRIRTDPDKLRIVLRNILHNALKFTEAGEVLVSVTAHPDRRAVTYVVRDTGRGIPAGQLSEIFEMFRQVRGEDGMTGGGAGLGLYIARRLTDLLGGELDVSSAPGRGSVFRVHVPVDGPLAAARPLRRRSAASATAGDDVQ